VIHAKNVRYLVMVTRTVLLQLACYLIDDALQAGRQILFVADIHAFQKLFELLDRIMVSEGGWLRALSLNCAKSDFRVDQGKRASSAG